MWDEEKIFFEIIKKYTMWQIKLIRVFFLKMFFCDKRRPNSTDIIFIKQMEQRIVAKLMENFSI